MSVTDQAGRLIATTMDGGPLDPATEFDNITSNPLTDSAGRLIIVGPGGGPLSAGSTIVPKTEWAGNSIVAAQHDSGDGYFDHADGIAARTASLIGAVETNVAADGSCALLDDNPDSWATVDNIGDEGGNWPTFAQAIVGARPRAPYLSPFQYVHFGWGINDIGAYGPVNAAFIGGWKPTMYALACMARLGHYVVPVATGLPSGWTNVASTIQNPGPRSWFASSSTPANIPLTVPADYDGAAIILLFGSSQDCSNTVSATINGGTPITLNIDHPAAMVSQLPVALRLPNSAGVVAGATITVAFSNVVGTAQWMGWGIESAPAPLVNISDTLRAPDYDAYSGAPYQPTDADVVALNAASVQVAAMFDDGMVITDGMDAFVDKTGGFFNSVHPDERLSGLIAAQLVTIIAGSGLAENLPVLGTA